MAAEDGAGTTVTFGTSGYAFLLLDVSGPEETVDDIPATHMASTAMEYVAASLVEGGEVTLTVLHDPSIAVTVGATAETITIDWSGGGVTDAFSGYINSYSRTGATIGNRREAVVKIKVTGAVS